tara:strand:- start:93 stop:482 length:390 start_codon:yes stop_codon:yes gene_type:complete
MLLKVGSSVKVELTKVKDELPIYLYNKIKTNPIAKIIDYKMTDGTGIGFVLEFESGERSWFFNEELSCLSEQSNQIKNDSKNIYIKSAINKRERDSRIKREYKVNNDIRKIINPLNFLSWLIYSSKDII